MTSEDNWPDDITWWDVSLGGALFVAACVAAWRAVRWVLA